jgi:hypothetical protein
MYPNLYKKNVIQYDKFSQMFHNKITKKSNKFTTNSSEKLNLARVLESFRFNNESIIERENPSVIFETKNRNKFCENKKSSEEKQNCVFTNGEKKSNFGFLKNSKQNKNAFNPREDKKFYYKKEFVIKKNENEEEDIISNFNLKHNKLYNHLLKTNSFSEIPKIKNQNHENNSFHLNFKDRRNRNSIDSFDNKKPFEHLNTKSKNKLKLSIETERSISRKIKNSFYYSLKGKLRKQAKANLAPGNFTAFKNDEINSNSNRGLFGSFYRDINTLNNNNNNYYINVNKKDIINEEVNLNNSQISMKIQDSKILQTKNESSQKLNLQLLEKINLERENFNNISPKTLKDIVLNNQIEREYADVEKNNNPIKNLVYNNNKEMSEDDFFRNFNISNMNNLNLSHIKLKKNFFTKTFENNNNNLQQEKIHFFPKTQARSNVNKNLALDGVFNIVELKTSLKKKKNKYIITNSHYLV